MEENNINGNAPTERQFVVIRKLARLTKSTVNLNNIKTKQEASKIIEDLIAKQNGMNGNNNSNNDCRDKKVAYGLSVKLVFCKFKERGLSWNSENFWNEVDEFYKQYIERQDRATKNPVKKE